MKISPLICSLFIFSACITTNQKLPPKESSTESNCTIKSNSVESNTIERATQTAVVESSSTQERVMEERGREVQGLPSISSTNHQYCEPTLSLETQPLINISDDFELNEALENYFTQLKSLDADSIISVTYPKLFVPINRDIFREYINKMFNSEDISITGLEITPLEVHPITPLSNGAFTQVKYLSNLQISFVNPLLYENELKMRFLADTLIQKYGYENVQVNIYQRTVALKREERLLAIKENGRWTFLSDNQEYRRLYPKILPYEILNSI